MKMKIRKGIAIILISLSVLILLSGVIHADEISENDFEKTLSPYFKILDNDIDLEQFPLKSTDIKANINGVIADVFVTQTYTNEGNKPINASYVFPVSTNASVHGMKMIIGDKIISAKIKERETAKKEFEEAKKAGRSASLLEQQRPNVFSMSVANIMPGDTIKIELHYTELLVPKDNNYQFVYPTVVGPRYSEHPASNAQDTDKFVESPYLKENSENPTDFNIAVNISSGVPFHELSSSSHDIDILGTNNTKASVSLSDTEINSGNRDFILDYRLAGDYIDSGLLLHKGEDENFFLLMMEPPARVTSEIITPREYIFVLDVSGSMSGYPLDTAKVLIKDLLGDIRETDKFNLVLFAGSSEKMSDTSVYATKSNIKEAINLIDSQNGGGGTRLLSALLSATMVPPDENFARSVVLISDGYISAENDVFDFINETKDEANYFSFGIGSSVNRYLIEGIAKSGSGEPFIATNEKDAARVAKSFKEYIEAPVLTDIDVSFESFNAYDVEPEKFTTMFSKKPLIIFGKWEGEPEGTIKITGISGNGNYSNEINVSDIKEYETSSAIPLLWARTRISNILDYGMDNYKESIEDEITGLGLKYSILTPYTSFIAVEEIIRNPDGNSVDTSQPLPLPKGVSNNAIGIGYGSMSEPDEFLLAAIFIVLLAIILLCKRSTIKTRSN
jgi:Ca-activated chloride channel family protein